MVNPLFPSARVLRVILPRPPPALSVRKKKTKGPRAATRLAAPWRQGTETGSIRIVTRTISAVNSQRPPLGQIPMWLVNSLLSSIDNTAKP
jgi:hypothetical protein